MSHIANKNTSTTTSTFHLFALPAEIRLTIYEFNFPDLQRRLQRRKTNPSSFRLPFLNACPLIWKEALPLYEKELKRILADSRDLVAKLKAKAHTLDHWWLKAWELDLEDEFKAIDGKWTSVQRRLMVAEYSYSQLKKAVMQERKKIKAAFLEIEKGFQLECEDEQL
ncbi:hypothetical protein AC579_1964 [Pseudocercospora musae]|uniref:F-box domain-containing protein n=1 Tax=Pseudocercospora musae TaxID=113226 RepID=A0A139I7Z9_9PEZI|nr:hypothetical protein AC579_1964 [Pseudocercospora musae]